MPKLSKVTKAVSTQPGAPLPPRETLNRYICARCGQIFKRQKLNFPCSQSSLYRGNNGYLPVCNHCIDDLFAHYKTALGGEKEAMRRVCMKFDIYWHPDIYGMISKANTSTSRVRSYISKTNLIKYVGKTYDDTLDEEARLVPIGYSPAADEDAENQAISFSDIPAPTAETVDFWGPGYTPEVYFDLDRRYKNWTSGKEEVLDESSAALYKQVCLCELNIARNMAAGKPIEAAQKSMSELLGSLNVKPVQKKQDEILNESFDNLPFGVGIKMCENMRPIPKPDPRFDDVDGIVRYISIWFLGHLCKMLGIRNTYCKLYEQEMARLKVERPELEAEDDESAFNDIFGDDVREDGG